jgi:hypothetical protein
MAAFFTYAADGDVAAVQAWLESTAPRQQQQQQQQRHQQQMPTQPDGSTAFWLASRGGHTAVLQELHTGQNWLSAAQTRGIGIPRNDGSTPLLAACGSGCVDAAKWLWARLETSERQASTRAGCNALRAAAGSGSVQLMSWLLAPARLEVLLEGGQEGGGVALPPEEARALMRQVCHVPTGGNGAIAVLCLLAARGGGIDYLRAPLGTVRECFAFRYALNIH